MTVQEVIDKAVEGGYHIYGSDGMDTAYEGATNDYSAWTRKDNLVFYQLRQLFYAASPLPEPSWDFSDSFSGQPL